ncbi:hypothetical protein [Sphingobium sp. Z007]|uniref:hypothetical protein n=1 Tax=Sphingobium sp. Z007 TaxID=627495 RepID=UPI0015954C3E|nr:hypothetical protein [Sphingobium sp. Z007]
MSAPIHFPVRFVDQDVITAADIEAWVKVERALSGKGAVCRTSRQGRAAVR